MKFFKVDTTTALLAYAIMLVLGAFIIHGKDEALKKCEAAAHKWEQLYRDCQAARQFSEPAHAADAVNDVTR